MPKLKFLPFLLIFVLLANIFCPMALASDGIDENIAIIKPEEPEVSAKYALLMDMDTGEILYQKNMDQYAYPASTTKIMTCYLILKYGNIYDYITLPDGIYQGTDIYSSTANLSAGEEVYVYELLQCLMLVSANEAANALAIYLSGSVEEFVALMNQEAQELGCVNTSFTNPCGLHDENHYTTAYDLSIIARAAMEYEAFRYVVGLSSLPMRQTNRSEERLLENTNFMIPGTDRPSYDYWGTLGIKTGFTTPAGYCLVSAVERYGIRLLAVVLGADGYMSDGFLQYGSFSDSIALYNWGYNNYHDILAYQHLISESVEFAETKTPELPEETPSEPAPEPEETPVPAPEISEVPMPEPPSPTPEAIIGGADAPTEVYVATNEKDIITTLSDQLGTTPQTILLVVISGAGILLLLTLLLMIHMLSRQKKK